MEILNLLKRMSLGAAAAAGLGLLPAVPAQAVPARPGLMTFDNGGKTIEVYLRGDEHSHYYVSSDGYMLLRGDDGRFRYALPDGDRLQESKLTASRPGARSVDEEALLASFAKSAPFKIQDKRVKARPRRNAPSRAAEESSLCTFPTKGFPRCLAILVEFQDVQFTLSEPNALFSRMLNEEGFSEYKATGSARDFFMASSGGQFAPQFDVYGPVKLPYNMSYYGANDESGNDARPYEMIPHVVDLLKDQIDFSIYDTDNDGIVDNIYVFYAGYGEADGGPANSIWPHSWNIHDDLGMEIYMNGKLLNHYATSNELSDGQGANLAGIGVFCHEFSHVMGLPDLYSTLYTSAFTPGSWSLMDHGSYNNNGHTPPYHTGYERYCLGWVDPKVLTDPKNVSMYPVSQIGAYDNVYMIPTPNRSEYYILENRQQKGWDEYIPGHGLLVWHIDFDPQMWLLNIVNIEKQYIDIVEADNEQSEYSRAGDTFPGSAGVTDFTDDTTPSMMTWNGTKLYSPITDITDTDGIVSFAFKGGENIFGDMVANQATTVKAGGFTASWNEVPRATGYLLSVYRKVTENGATRNEYVDGFLKREVGSTGTFEVTGLTPSTTYYYVVSATNGRFYSPESNEIEVVTLDPTLDYKKVQLMPATEVTETGFRANWQKLDDADSYEVTLYRLELGEPFTETADFTDRVLPSGWTTDASFDGRASYAVEVPSARMTTDGSHITTASFSAGVRAFSFWYRAASSLRNGRLEISALLSDGWQTLATVSDLVSATGGATVSFSEFPAGATRARITLKAPEGGSISIDDVCVGYGGNVDYQIVPESSAINVGDEDSYLFTGLTNETDYGYSVTAVNSEFRSKDSGIQGVHTGFSGVEDTMADGTSIKTDGLTLTVIVAGQGQVIVRDIMGRTVASAAGQLHATMPSHGVYLVTAGGKTTKVIL